MAFNDVINIQATSCEYCWETGHYTDQICEFCDHKEECSGYEGNDDED